MAPTTAKPANAGVAESMPPLQAESTANLPAMRPRSPGSSMAVLPQNWQEITAIAGAICRARMAPKSYCDQDGNPQPEKVAIAIMHGLEVGFTPMASLQSLAVINGMPSVYGDGLLALIKASGLLEDIEESMEWDKTGPIAATCKMWRRGEKTPSIQVYAREDAMKAGLWGKRGPWTDHPARMLQWRARGWCGRDKFPDVLRGLHSAEEAQDMVDVTDRGSVTTGPKPDEPTRETVKKNPAATSPADGGQAATSPPAAGGGDRKAETMPPAKPEAAAQPAHDPKTGEVKETRPIKAHTGKRTKKGEKAATVTDATDLNAKPAEGQQAVNETTETPGEETSDSVAGANAAAPAEPLTFEMYATARQFFEFSDPWLEDPARTPAEAKQWEKFYRSKIKEMSEHEFQRVKDAITETIKLYSAVLAKEQPE